MNYFLVVTASVIANFPVNIRFDITHKILFKILEKHVFPRSNTPYDINVRETMKRVLHDALGEGIYHNLKRYEDNTPASNHAIDEFVQWLNSELSRGVTETLATVMYRRYQLKAEVAPQETQCKFRGVTYRSLSNAKACRGECEGQTWEVVCPSGIRIVLRLSADSIGRVKSMYLGMNVTTSMAARERVRIQVEQLKLKYLPSITTGDSRPTTGYCPEALYVRLIVNNSNERYLVDGLRLDHPDRFNLIRYPDGWWRSTTSPVVTPPRIQLNRRPR